MRRGTFEDGFVHPDNRLPNDDEDESCDWYDCNDDCGKDYHEQREYEK